MNVRIRASSFPCLMGFFAISLAGNFARADTRSLSLPAVPSAVTTVPSIGRVYIATARDILVFDPQNDSVLATIPLTASPLSFAFDPTYSTLFVPSSRGNFVDLVDAPSNQVPVVIPLSSPPTAIALDPSKQRLYAALPAEKILKVVDMSGLPFEFAADVHLPDIPTALAFNPGAQLIYIALASGDLVTMGTATQTLRTPDMERPVNYELRFIFLSSFVLFPLGSSAGRGRGSCNDD